MQAVYFIVLPQTLLLDLVGIADAFRIADRLNGDALFTLRYVSGVERVPTSLGIELSGLEPYPERIETDAWIVIPGMMDSAKNLESEATKEAVRWLRRVYVKSHTICCVCAGAFVAGQAGLLNGRRCTTHHDDVEALRAAFPTALVQENRIFVEDGSICSSAGVTSGIDLALSLIAKVATAMLAARVARELVVYLRRAGADPQLSPWVEHRNHMNPVVHRAQEAVLNDPTRDWSIASLANVSHASVRTLSRLFRSEAGLTPLDYVQKIRLTLARELIANTSWSVERVASSSGFSSAHQLRRIWRKEESTSPTKKRGSRVIRAG